MKTRPVYVGNPADIDAGVRMVPTASFSTLEEELRALTEAFAELAGPQPKTTTAPTAKVGGPPSGTKTEYFDPDWVNEHLGE